MPTGKFLLNYHSEVMKKDVLDTWFVWENSGKFGCTKWTIKA